MVVHYFATARIVMDVIKMDVEKGERDQLAYGRSVEL